MSQLSTNDISDQMQCLPMLPLRDVVVYPQMVVPLFVGRAKSIAALQAAMAADKKIFLVAQRRHGCHLVAINEAAGWHFKSIG